MVRERKLGFGFGQQDLANVRVGQIDRQSYGLRRSKAGIDRYGDTPPLDWAHIKRYVVESSRERGDLLFVTQCGRPLVHYRGDSVTQWWSRPRKGKRAISAKKLHRGIIDHDRP